MREIYERTRMVVHCSSNIGCSVSENCGQTMASLTFQLCCVDSNVINILMWIQIQKMMEYECNFTCAFAENKECVILVLHVNMDTVNGCDNTQLWNDNFQHSTYFVFSVDIPVCQKKKKRTRKKPTAPGTENSCRFHTFIIFCTSSIHVQLRCM